MKYLKEIMKEKTKRSKCFPMLLFMVMCVMLLLPTAQVQAASAKSKALKAYKAFLSQTTIPWGTDSYYTAVPSKNCSFALVYIDKNTVPELVVKNMSDITHVAGFGVVFTYKNDKVQPVANIQLDGKFYYYKKKGIYAGSYLSSGMLSYSYCKMSGVKSTAKLTERKDTFSGKKTYYKANSGNGKVISKSKFTSSLKKLVGSTKRSTAKFYKNTKKNRTKYLK